LQRKTAKLEGANLGKISSQKIRELGFHHRSSLSLCGGKMKNIYAMITDILIIHIHSHICPGILRVAWSQQRQY